MLMSALKQKLEMKMKLIDILVEELPKRGGWPDGAARLAQDPDGDIQMLSNRHA